MAACGWVVDWTGTPYADDASAALDKAVAEALASASLWALSGRVFGVCEETVRPCPDAPPKPSTYAGPSGHAGWWPTRINPGWASGGCGCTTPCRCSAHRTRVALPGPVDSIVSVRIDGALVDPVAYRVQDRRWLVRIDGQLWPARQDLTVPDDAPGAFVVRYRRGIPIPPEALAVLRDLAVEFIKARRSGGKCAIPARAQSIVRQGVDIELVDPATLYDGGLTGVESVDRWLASVNPGGKRRAPSRVYSPDAPRTVRMR
ncbi:hypothetical protein [Nocardia farcinica]